MTKAQMREKLITEINAQLPMKAETWDWENYIRVDVENLQDVILEKGTLRNIHIHIKLRAVEPQGRW